MHWCCVGCGLIVRDSIRVRNGLGLYFAFYQGIGIPNDVDCVIVYEISRPDRVNMVEMYHLLAWTGSDESPHLLTVLRRNVPLSPQVLSYTVGVELRCRMASTAEM